MSPLRLRMSLRRSRRRLVVVLALLALGGAVAVHHAMPDMHSMPGHTICLAVLAGAALLAVGISAARDGRPVLPRPLLRLALRSLVIPAPRTVPARAGPIYLRLGVLRR